MASQSSRGLGTRSWGLGARGWGLDEPTAQKKRGAAKTAENVFLCVASALFAVSAVSSLSRGRRADAARAGADRGARAARHRAAAGAAARSRSPRVRGTHGARRPAQARDRRAAQGRRAQARRRRRREGTDRARRDQRADGDAAGVGAAEIPELQQRLVEIYKLGQARYLRLLLSTADLRRLGQSTRTVAALAKLDRDRVATHATTLAELKKDAPGARRAPRGVRHAPRRRPESAGRRATRRAGQDRSHPRHRQAARSERAAVGRAAGRAAEAAGDAARSRDGRVRRPKPSCRSGRSAATSNGRWPDPSSGGSDAVRRRTASKSPRSKAPAPSPSTTAPSRLRDRLPDSGIWSSSITAARPSVFTAICWRSASRKEPGSSTASARHGRADPVGLGRHLLRAPRRRSAGRSLTMVEETLDRTVNPEP